MNQRVSSAIGWLGCFTFAATASAAVRYAKVTATGLNNCNTWADACTLSNAIAGADALDQVWVQAGTYPPIVLKEGVKIIGGFAGTETAASQSNPVSNVTTIDGGGVDRAVYSENHTAATMLRGFKIANGYDGDDFGGGGLILWNSSPVIVQCIFEHNTAAYVGGAVMVRDVSSPQFINCIFRHNGATWPSDGPPYGGGAVFASYWGSITFVNCLFYDNRASEGGAVENACVATFTNCTMTGNHATTHHGGAVRDPFAIASFNNCIVWGNTGYYGALNDQQISSGTRASQVSSVTYSDVQGGWTGTGNIDADPLFLNAAGGNYAISTSSPCKNAGNNLALPADVADLDWDGDTGETLPKDLSSLTRVLRAIVDLGAYEAFASGGGGGQ